MGGVVTLKSAHDGGIIGPTSPTGSHAEATTSTSNLLSASKSPGNGDRLSGQLALWTQEYLILPKLIYLTLNCTIYATHNYTAMYFYEMWGLEVYQFGAVSSLSAVQFVGALFWAHLADKTGRHKSILLACTALYGLFFCLLQLNLFESKTVTNLKIVYSAVMYGLSCFFVSCLFPLVDTQVFSILSKDPNFTKETFGRQRLWGTIGHGVVTLAVGISIYIIGYAGMFIVLVISCISFAFFVLIGIPADIQIVKATSQHENHGASRDGVIVIEEEPREVTGGGRGGGGGMADIETGKPPDCTKSLMKTPVVRVLLNPHFFFLAIVIMCAGYVRSVMSNFLVFYMQTEMKQGTIIVAFTIMFRMASEIAIFFYNKQLLRVIGLHWMLIIAQVAGLLRVLAYSLLPPSGNWFYLSFLIELLKGTSTGCLISSGVRMANDIAPKGCQNTAQAYISGIYSGLSLAIGGALGGLLIYLLPNHSVASMFRITFYMGLIALILCVLKYSLIDRVIIVPKSWRGPQSSQPSSL